MRLTEQQRLLLRRKKGEKNLSIMALANSIGVSRWTIAKVINGNENLKTGTVNKIVNWLIKESL